MSDAHASANHIIRRLERENDALRLKSARHEFRQLEQELLSDDPFKLDIITTDAFPGGCTWMPDGDTQGLPTLSVPAGSIQPTELASDFPVIAVHDDGLTGRALAAALLGLLKTQYRDPFARLVFLCSSFEPVPLLGRYGFAVEHVGQAAPASIIERLHRRYGVYQIRSVATGALIVETAGR